MSSETKEIYEFSRFRLEASERKLLRDGKTVPLTDKAFDTLCVLVRQAGELVSKDELMSRVWIDTVVEENNLDQKISMIRRALGERAGGKIKIIETVRGHGYRFLPQVNVIRDVPRTIEAEGQVREWSPVRLNPVIAHSNIETRRDGNVVAVASWQKPESDDSRRAVNDFQPSVANPPTQIPVVRSRIGRRAALLAFVLALAVIGLSYLDWTAFPFLVSEQTTDTAVIDSIAVMPFVNETGNPDNDFLSDGLTESLIGSLSQVAGLSVKARNTVFRYRGKAIDVSAVGRDLSVSGVLLGRFTQQGDNLTLSLELVDPRDGDAIWAQQYDRRASEIVSLQSEVARDVSSKLRSRLSKADRDRVAKVHTANAAANRLYLQGMYHLHKRTAEDIRKSIELFEQATIEDPDYAKAFAGSGTAYLILPDYVHGLNRDEYRAYDQKFRAAFHKAYALDKTLPEAVLLSAAAKDVDWDVEGADQEYRRAIELDPNFAAAHHWYSRFLGAIGKNEEALSQIQKASELDPFSRSIAFNIGGRLADARRFDEAIVQYKKVLEMEPGHPLTHLALAMSFDAKGMYKEAIGERQIAEVLLEKSSKPEARRKARELAKAVESGGASGYWEKRLEFSRQDKATGIGSDYDVATCLARLSRVDESFEFLDSSLRNHEPALFWIKTESAFDHISYDPRFRRLLSQIGLPY